MSSSSTATQVDDRDPRINYFGAWFDVSTGNGAVFNGTLSSASEAGAGFGFVFTGIQVSVYGTVGSKNGALPPITTYTIDNNPPVTFAAPPLTVEGDQLLFFQSGQLNASAHQIIVNTTRATGDAPFYVDYLTVLPVGAAFPSSSSSTSSSTTTSDTSSGSSTAGGNTSPSPPATASSSTTINGSGNDQGGGNSGQSSSNTGPIVGGVVGGVAVVVLLLLALWFWRRRRRDPTFRYSDNVAPTPAMEEAGPTPGPVGSVAARNYSSTDGEVTPYMLPRDYNDLGSHVVSNIGEGVASGTQAMSSTKYLGSVTSAAPYFVNPEASASRPLLDPASGSEYSSSASPPVHAIPETPVSQSRILHSPNSSSNISHEKQPLSPESTMTSRSQGIRALPVPSAVPAQHADSGVRFGPATRPDSENAMSVSPLGAPPAYSAD